MSSLSTEQIRQQLAVTDATAVPLMVAPPVETRIEIDQVIGMVDEQVTIRPVAATPTSHLAVEDEAWTWRELRDYVAGQIEQRFGVFPRDDKKEMGIFKSFSSRYPDGVAARIAKHAFEDRDGYWRGAPVSITRFCRGSDPYFGDVIVSMLVH